MALRVRHVVCLAPPRMGGMGAAALRWCEGLQERGVDVELVVPETYSKSPSHPLIRPWPAYLVLGNGAIFQSVSKLWNDIDVLHLHYPFFGAAEFLLMKKTPKPVVVTFHMDAEPTGWRKPFVMAQRLLLQKMLLRHAAKICVSSFDYLSSSSARFLYNEDPSKWIELPFFVDDTIFIPRPESRSADLSDSPVLNALFVGVLDRAHQFKGIREAIEAIAQTPKTKLTIIGDGDSRAEIEAEVRTKGLVDRVVFCGRVSQEELIRAYQQADVLLFPSTNRAEAFGLVALEAQACGTPVIASWLPGVRTVVIDGETGILVEPGSVSEIVSALNRMTNESGWRMRLGKNARAHVEAHFRRENLLDRQIQIYQDVCASR